MPAELWLIFILVRELASWRDSVVRAHLSFGFVLSFWAKERIFTQGYPRLAYVQAPILHQSTKPMKTNIPSRVGPGSRLTPYLLRPNTIQELNYRRDPKQDERRGIILWYGFQPPATPLIKLPNNYRDTTIWCRKRPERNGICQGMLFPIRWVFLVSDTPMRIIVKKH